MSLGDLGYLADFGLGDKSWIDIYIDGDFKSFRFQGTGSITVEKGRPVLIRLRPTLRDELTDCPGITEYLEKQPKARTKGKRSANSLVSPIKSKISRLDTETDLDAPRSNQLILLPSRSPTPDPLDNDSPFLSSVSTAGVLSGQSPLLRPGKSFLPSVFATGTTTVSSSLSAPLRPVKSQAKSKGKRTISRWPHDFYVTEIADGLHKLKSMKDANKRSSLIANFEEVFGLPYHKTTFAKYRGLMDSDDNVIQDIIEAYISEGTGDNGLWPTFAEAIKDRVAFLKKGDSEDVLDDFDMDDAKSTCGSDGSESVHTRSSLVPHSDDETASYSGHEIITRCPYCDERLPSSPTQQLVNMRAALEPKSLPDPLPGNPDHRKTATFRVYQEFCARHRLELEVFPLARSEKWPEDPDMAELRNRVDKLRPQLQLLFDIDILSKNKFFKKAKATFSDLGRTRADGIDVQYSKYSGHGAG